MHHNIYEFLYIIISSSISHALLVIGIVYIVFHIVIVNDTEDQIAKGFVDYFKTYIDITKNYINNDPDIDKSVKDLINNDINKSELIKYLPNITDNIKQKAVPTNKEIIPEFRKYYLIINDYKEKITNFIEEKFDKLIEEFNTPTEHLI